MKIKNFTNGVIPNLINYQPFQLSENKIICQSVDEMIEYGELENSYFFEYELGTNTTFNITFFVKNITDNATLKVQPTHDSIVFVETEEITLLPGEQKNVTVNVNSEYLNTTTGLEENLILTIEITNIANGQLITKTVS